MIRHCYWHVLDDVNVPLKNTNVVIAAYTTAHARLELYKYLKEVGENAIYMDTESYLRC